MVTYVNALLYGVGGIVVAGMALLVAFQEKLVYVPVLPGLTKSYQITPSRLRLTYEDVFLHASDGVRLHSWFIKLFPDCRGHRSLSLSLSLSHSFAVGVCFRVLGFGCCDISHIHTYRSCFPSIRVLQLELEHSAFVFLFWNFYVWWNFEFRASEFFEELGRCFTELGFCCCQVIGIQCLESLNSSWSVLGFCCYSFLGFGFNGCTFT